MEYKFITSPEIELKYITPDYAEMIEWAGRQSTASRSKGEAEKFVRARVKDGHLSLGRFGYAMFEIHCSRSCSMQLLRHKFIEWCQQSQRYVKQEPLFIIPPSIDKRKDTSELYKESCIRSYNDYLKIMESGILKEDGRFLLPSSCITSLAMCLNFQAARDFLNLRLAKAAQWEIRIIALKIGEILLKEAGDFFFDFSEIIETTKKSIEKEVL